MSQGDTVGKPSAGIASWFERLPKSQYVPGPTSSVAGTERRAVSSRTPASSASGVLQRLKAARVL